MGRRESAPAAAPCALSIGVLAGAGRDFYPDRAARAGRAELFGDLGGARSTGIAPLPTVGMASPKKTEQ